ncbi:MAG TPA: hypothetical protein VE912_17350 [Bacteroidales bacterium]|nr:hypothetical protein [Bacteroidales bacterium]
MKKLLIKVAIVFFCISCTEIRYIQQPIYPILSLMNEKILIWPFQHISNSIAVRNNNELLNKLKGQSCALIIPFDSVSNICYRNLIDFSDSMSVDQMFTFYSITNIRYILKGKLLNKSNKNGLLGPFLYEYEKKIYYPFSSDEGRWLTYEFDLYDLALKAKIYTLKVEAEAVSQDFKNSSGDIGRVYSLSSTNLNAIALKKGIKKLKKTFNCH